MRDAREVTIFRETARIRLLLVKHFHQTIICYLYDYVAILIYYCIVINTLRYEDK